MTEVLDIVNEVVFDDLIATGDPVVVDFSAPGWCVPCQRLLPHFTNAAQRSEYTTFVTVDVDKAQWAMVRFGIQSVPTVKLFENGGYVKDITSRTVVQILKELE